MKPANDNAPKITADTIEDALDRVALAMDKAGPQGAAYLPIYERLEAELVTVQANDNRLARARKRVRK